MDKTFLATVRVEAALIEVPIDAENEHEAKSEIERWLSLGARGSWEGIRVLSLGETAVITVDGEVGNPVARKLGGAHLKSAGRLDENTPGSSSLPATGTQVTDKPQLEDWRVTAERVYQERQQRQVTMTEEAPPTSTPGPPQPPVDESPILKWWHGMTSRGRGLTIGAAIGLALIVLAQFGEPVEPTKTAAPEPALVQTEAPKAAPAPVPAPAPEPEPEAAPPAPEPAPAPPVAAPAPKTLQAELEERLGPSNRDLPKITTVDEEGSTIVVRFTIDDNLTRNMTARSAQRDVVDILDVTHARHPGKHIVVSGTFSMVDKYGNTSESQVLLLNYSPYTLARINWSDDGKLLVRENIYDLADTSER